MINPIKSDTPLTVLHRFTNKPTTFFRHLKNTKRLETYVIDNLIFVPSEEIKRLLKEKAIEIIN